MYLSELYGRIGQILRECGDMKVVRCRSLKIDGIVDNESDNFVHYNSDDFIIANDYKKIDDDTIKRIGRHFIINTPK